MADKDVIDATLWPEIAHFAAQMKEARLDREWSQKDLADATGLTQPYVSAIESTRQNPSLMVTAQIARALGLPLRDMMSPRIVKLPPRSERR